ncbi:MAG TPA: response regulator [Tepidisphaeraceae bacterium]|jgi:PAS domain S-box-containing protein|nr:response regulator [Tepidisphaeraceae bacterium]
MNPIDVNVLLVEDNPADAALMRHALANTTSRRFHLTHVTRLDQAIVHLQHQRFDALLLDLGLPDSQGLQTLQRTRQHCPSIPVVVLTGLDDESAAIAALQQGAQDYLVKGQPENIITRAIRYAIERKSAEEVLLISQQRLAYAGELKEANEALLRNERELQQAKEAAEAAHQAKSVILEMALDAIITIDSSGVITAWNAQAESMFSWSREEAVGVQLHQTIIPPRYRDMHLRGIEHFKTMGEGPVLNKRIEIVALRRSGEEFPVELWITPVTSRGKHSFTAFIRDITDRKQAEVQLLAAKDAAEAANSAKSEFLANMSHEIRTPMTAILGYTDMLLAPDQSSSDRLECVSTIRRESEHLLSVLNDILDLSKIEAGKLDVERIVCRPSQIVNEAVSFMRVRAIEKGIKLGVTFAGQVPETIRTDPTRFRQILLNLIGNAIKFTRTGGIQAVVSLDHDTAGPEPRLRVEVLDSGIGLSPEQLSGLFRPFCQADASTTRCFGGTGLGLVISRRLAGILGGTITAQSRVGYGSRFVLTVQTGSLHGVPMMVERDESVTDAASATSADQKTQLEDPRLNARVLLAEDGLHNQRVIAFYLQQAGAQVTIADNGRIACEKATKAAQTGQPFDLILMDMQMPELDGYAATANLRNNGFTLPIIALTAHAMSQDREKCLKAGCTDYLTKPIEKAVMLNAIARHIRADKTAANSKAPAPPPTKTIPIRTEPLRSTVATDPEMADFLITFVNDLPRMVNDLSTLQSKGDLAGLASMLHQLKGTGGLYGFMPITDQATLAERRLKETKAIDAANAEIHSLLDLIRRVEGYDRAKETTPPINSPSPA